MKEERYVQATNVTPGNAAIVHHVIFEVPESRVNSVRKKDTDAGPGYTCFGGAGVGASR